FDAWGRALDHGLHAADQLGDTRSQAWALDRLGNRAALLGNQTAAKDYLQRAASLHASLGDSAAAAMTRRNLDLVRPRGFRAFRESFSALPTGVRVLAAGVAVVAVGGSLAAGYARPARGPRGAAGPQGAPGKTGPRGEQGKPGTAAAKGDTGDTGQPGKNGTNGTNGKDGKNAIRLWAVVNADGTIAQSADPTAQTDRFDGKRSYTVTFTRDISACSWLAVPSANPNTHIPPPTS